MTSIHRRLFDEKLMSVDSDYRIVFHDPKEQERTYAPYERKLTIDLHGKRIGLPFQKRHRPLVEWIEKRNRTIPWWPAR
jgi:putative restriction endonuclease